jgi:transcriptional regulator GlxA family with amidase domain
VQDRLTQSLQLKLSIETLAEQVNMSPRNLTRLFKKTTQVTIGNYLDMLRAGLAEQLLKEGQTLQSVAAQCGLKSTNQLRHILQKFGTVQH